MIINFLNEFHLIVINIYFKGKIGQTYTRIHYYIAQQVVVVVCHVCSWLCAKTKYT